MTGPAPGDVFAVVCLPDVLSAKASAKADTSAEEGATAALAKKSKPTIATNGAVMTSRIHRPARVLSPRHQIQIDERPPALVDRLVERLLRLLRRARPHPSQAIRDAMDMDVDTDVLSAPKREDHHQVRRLSAHSRQRDQLLHRRGHSTAERVDDHPAGVLHEYCFIAVEADRVDQSLDLS